MYTATLGVLVAEPPKRLSSVGDPVIGFGRASVTWRALDRLNLTVQVDVHSSPYRSSNVDVLADPVVMLGFGGSIQVTDTATLELAVTEDDGTHRAGHRPAYGFTLAALAPRARGGPLLSCPARASSVVLFCRPLTPALSLQGRGGNTKSKDVGSPMNDVEDDRREGDRYSDRRSPV